MNFDKIENLSEEQIFKLYSDIIENSSIYHISGNGTEWYIKCTNGKAGYYYYSGGRNAEIGQYWFGNYCDAALSYVCGDCSYAYFYLGSYDNIHGNTLR